ncbi:MAG: hypothetical protein IJY16_09770, partial [Clostridia bacterium]|nr:hypothetical protein [Clostridia bacterium]
MIAPPFLLYYSTLSQTNQGVSLIYHPQLVAVYHQPVGLDIRHKAAAGALSNTQNTRRKRRFSIPFAPFSKKLKIFSKTPCFFSPFMLYYYALR